MRSAFHIRAFVSIALACAGSSLIGCSSMKSGGRHDLVVTPVEELDEAELRRALAEAERFGTENPGDAYWPFRRAELCAALDSTCAESALAQALGVDPGHAPSLTLLSKLFFEQARHEEAIERLEVALESAPNMDPADRHLVEAGLALHYDALGDVGSAEIIVDELLEADVDWAIFGPVLTFLRLRGEDVSTATEPAARSLLADKDSAINLNNFGISELQAGRPESAKKAFLEASKRDPDLPGPYYNLAILEKFYLFDDEAAEHAFVRYWALSQHDPDALAELFQGAIEQRIAASEGQP